MDISHPFFKLKDLLTPYTLKKTPGQVTSRVYCCLFFLGFCRNRRPAVKFIKMANFKQTHNNDYVKEILHYSTYMLQHSCVYNSGFPTVYCVTLNTVNSEDL